MKNNDKFNNINFETAKIAVVGDVMLDRYWYGDSSRISPEAPVPVVRIKSNYDRPGGAGNVALNINAIGGKASLFSIIGDDETGKILRQQLDQHGVECTLQTINNFPTTNKLRVISHQQQLIRLDFEEALAEIDFSMLLTSFRQKLAETKVVIISDYGKGINKEIAAFIKLAKEKNIPILVDPKSKDFNIYRGATLITPNLAEFEAVVGPCENDKMLADKAKQLIADYDLEALLITRGAQGMTLVQKNQQPFHIAAKNQEVFDVTGAGDTVIAIVAAALASSESLEDAATIANIAAGIVVKKLGAATVTASELRRAIKSQQNSLFGVIDENRLLQEVLDAKAHGEKIVMTNGCFDILHSGHIEYLEKAKAMGDRLIVAVNDDESVKRLKGQDRPVNLLSQRMQVLAGLKAIDWVTSFSEDTPERILSLVKPDVLVKGGDYKASEVVGRDLVLANGGKVEIVPFVSGFSSSNIIEKIKQI